MSDGGKTRVSGYAGECLILIYNARVSHFTRQLINSRRVDAFFSFFFSNRKLDLAVARESDPIVHTLG